MSKSKKKGVKQVLILALIKMSGIGITEISGKAGGSVFSRGRGGAYVRNRVVPSNPQTVAQQAVRATFGAISSAWRSLTEQQRDEWNAITADYPTQNRLGETKILSGKALFQKLNMNLLTAGESMKSAPAAPEGVNAPIFVEAGNFEVNAGQTAVTGLDVAGYLATGEDSGDNDTWVFLEATPPLSPGVKNANSRFVTISKMKAIDSNFSFDDGSVYSDVFGVPAVGSQVQFRVTAVNPNTGEKSSVIKASVLVTEQA